MVAYQQAHERVRGRTVGGIEAARREITIFDLLTMTSGVASMSRTPAVHWPTLRGAWEGSGFAPGDTRFNDPTKAELEAYGAPNKSSARSGCTIPRSTATKPTSAGW